MESEPRYSKNGVRITKKKTDASRRNIQKSVALRRAYSTGEIPLPCDNVARSRDGRIITEKWLKSNRATSARMKGTHRVDVTRKIECQGLEFPTAFLDRLNVFVGGKGRRVRFIEKFIASRIKEEVAQGITTSEIQATIPPPARTPGGTPVRVVRFHREFLDKVSDHVGDKSLRIRYMVKTLTTYMDEVERCEKVNVN